eukprot:3936368-Rhodomonas_salina.1
MFKSISASPSGPDALAVTASALIKHSIRESIPPDPDMRPDPDIIIEPTDMPLPVLIIDPTDMPLPALIMIESLDVAFPELITLEDAAEEEDWSSSPSTSSSSPPSKQN